ncbi:hypothetical protein [Brucella pseudogrignonensis]|uniref:hypothetical protein n=1 Tax=Brucella pseudogrignonensis TaxID=419475 RepID=UPI000B996692|nr:hypothetical protein [Brucella pseudogrignonensis]NKX16209.1 hypothetical protein [Brucella pseudogrignonensis]
MCFKPDTPKVPEAPAVPSEDAEAAKSRRAAEQDASRQAQGRASTIITTPLGAQDYGNEENRRRTTISGF